MTQPAEITSRADWALLTQNLREFNEQIDALYLRITDPGDDAEPSDGETEDPAAAPETSATAQPEPDDAQPQDPQQHANPSETEEGVPDPDLDPDQATDPLAEAENAELERRQQELDADAYDDEVEQDIEDQRRLDYESDGDLDGDYDPDLGVDG